MRYPLDLPSTYYMSLGFMEYTRPDPFFSLIRLTEIQDGNIQLPIPGNLIDSQTLKWGEGSALLGETIGDTYDMVADPAKRNGQEVLTDLAATGLSIPGAIGGFLGGSFTPQGANQTHVNNAQMNGRNAGNFLGDTTKALLQRSGLALNPVLAMMFDHPAFKTHQFMWLFSADTPAESETIHNIIETIRYNALPEAVGNGLFFKYPSIAHIKMHTGDKELYRFQPCVITNIEVNYAPTGTPSFYVGTYRPTLIAVSLSLVEIILNTRNNTVRSGASMAPKLDLTLGQNAMSFKEAFNKKIRGMI